MSVTAASAPTPAGLLLLAHGSSDPQWAAPFEQIARSTRDAYPGPVVLGYLERMAPDADAAIDELVRAGATQAVIVPLLLAAGSHVRRDLPALCARARARHPVLTITVSDPVGEVALIQHAIVSFALAQAKAATPAACAAQSLR